MRHDPLDHAGPPGVGGRYHPGDGVGEQDGHTVRRQHGEGEPTGRGHQTVDRRGEPGGPRSVDLGDVIAVHLVHPDDQAGVQTQRLGGQFTIDAYGVGVVADRSAEVELLIRSGAHPAPPVGEGEVRAAHALALSYHFRKSGTSSSSAALSE